MDVRVPPGRVGKRSRAKDGPSQKSFSQETGKEESNIKD